MQGGIHSPRWVGGIGRHILGIVIKPDHIPDRSCHIVCLTASMIRIGMSAFNQTSDSLQGFLIIAKAILGRTALYDGHPDLVAFFVERLPLDDVAFQVQAFFLWSTYHRRRSSSRRPSISSVICLDLVLFMLL